MQPLNKLRMASLNARTNLSGTAVAVREFMTANSLHVLFLSDPGRDANSPETRQALQPFTLLLNSSGPHFRSTGILIARELRLVNKLLTDPSGGFLAQDIQYALPQAHRSTGILRLIAVYQPPGLDTAFASEQHALPVPEAQEFEPYETSLRGTALRAEATRMRAVLCNWKHAPEVDGTIAAGDFNETLDGTVDRITQHDNGTCQWGQQSHGPLRQLLEQDKWGTDLYAHCHTPPQREQGEPRVPADSLRCGHTFYGNATTGSSRISHFLLTGIELPARDEMEIFPVARTTSPLTALSDHIPLLCSIPLTVQQHHSGTAHTKSQMKMKHLTTADYLRYHQQADDYLQASGLLNHLLRRLNSLRKTQGPAVLEEKFESILIVLRQLLLRTAKKTCGISKPGPRRHTPLYRTTAQIRLDKVYTQFATLRSAILHSQSQNCTTYFSPAAARAIRQLSSPQLRARDLLPQRARTEWTSLALWNAWLLRCPALDQRLRHNISTAAKASPRHPKNIRREQFRTATGRGRFYKTAFTAGGPASIIGAARDANDVIQYDPAIYKPIIRSEAAKPFSDPHYGPTVPTWRTLSPSEHQTGRPDWFDQHARRDAKNLPAHIFGKVMDSADNAELRGCLQAPPNGVTPGDDGIALDFLKMITGAFPALEDKAHQTLRRQGFLDLLTALVNALFRTQHCPQSLKQGMITLIPKPGKDSSIVSNCRPITLLSELGKLPQRILASRILRTAQQAKLRVFEPAQRAHDKEGCYQQAVRTLLNVLQDWKLQKAKRGQRAGALVLLSYDVRKAFDSVQWYSIEASCRRFNLPDTFITYLLNTLKGATSSVQTKDGPTEPFDILTSVRQGDPLSPIIFNILLDLLHEGLRSNPLHTAKGRRGYRMRGGTIISSIGFADDTVALASSWEDAQQQHLWVLEFFAAHRLRLNASKTVVVVDGVGPHAMHASYTGPKSAPDPYGLFLPDVDPNLLLCADQRRASGAPQGPTPPTPLQNTEIITYPPSYAFRYLGYKLRVDLQPAPMINALHTKVLLFCRELRSYHLDILQSTACIREVLYPRMELGLTFTPIPLATLNRWDTWIRHAVLRKELGSQLGSIRKELVAAATDILPLRDHRLLLQGTALCETLRGPGDLPSTRSSSDILNSLQHYKLLKTLPPSTLGIPLNQVNAEALMSKSQRTQGNQYPRIINELRARCRITITRTPTARTTPRTYTEANATRSALWSPTLQRHVDLRPFHATNPCALLQPLAAPERAVYAFTDGSFQSGESPGRGGWGAVLVAEELFQQPDFAFQEDRIVCIGGGSCTAGGNYAAECMAFIAVLHATPPNTPLVFYTDSYATLLALNFKITPTFKQQLKWGCRGHIRTISNARSVRQSLATPTTIHHVYAHTEGKDLISLGNGKADLQADAEAVSNDNIALQMSPFLLNEDPAIAWVQKDPAPEAPWTHINGNIRPCLKGLLQRASIDRLRPPLNLPTHTLCNASNQIHTISKQLRSSHNVTLFTFFLRAIAYKLPTATTLLWEAARTPTALCCPVCECATASSQHALSCPKMRPFIESTQQPIRRTLEDLTAILLNCPSLSPVEKTYLETLPTALHWFSPFRPQAEREWAHQEYNDQLQTINASDHYTSMLGIMPGPLKNFLIPSLHKLGYPERTHRAISRIQLHLWAQLRQQLIRTSYTIFRRWQQLCRDAYSQRGTPRTDTLQGYAL